MGRKSSIARAPEEVRATIDLLIRKGRFTLDEIRHYVEEKHGPQHVPARSSLGRYSKAQEEMLGRMREIDAAARVVVEELGESPDDRAGAFLVQSITTLAADASMRAQTNEKTSIEDVRKLARAAKDVISARTASLKERQAIEAAARDKLQREQLAKLDAIERKGGASPELRKTVREIMGIA